MGKTLLPYNLPQGEKSFLHSWNAGGSCCWFFAWPRRAAAARYCVPASLREWRCLVFSPGLLSVPLCLTPLKASEVPGGDCGAGLNLSCLPVLSLGFLVVEKPATTGQLGRQPSSAGWLGPRGKGLWSQATPRQEVLGGVQSLPVRTSRQGLVSGT